MDFICCFGGLVLYINKLLSYFIVIHVLVSVMLVINFIVVINRL